jgi:hypothetical protein
MTARRVLLTGTLKSGKRCDAELFNEKLQQLAESGLIDCTKCTWFDHTEFQVADNATWDLRVSGADTNEPAVYVSINSNNLCCTVSENGVNGCATGVFCT